MIEAYAVGVVLKLEDLVSVPVTRISKQFEQMDIILSAINKNLKVLGVESEGLKALSVNASSVNKHMAMVNVQAERLEKNLLKIKGIGTVMSAGSVPQLPIPTVPRGSHIGGGGHQGGIHYGAGGVGMSTATLGLGAAGAVLAGGLAAVYVGHKFYEAAKDFDLEYNKFKALGLSESQNSEALAFVKNMKTFGVSMTQNMTAFRDAQTIFRDSGSLEHSKIVTPFLAKMHLANAYLGGEEHAGEMEKKFMDFLKVIELRKGINSEKEFERQGNMVHQVMVTSGGRVQANELLNVIKTGGTAAYGLSNEAFYYKLEPLIQELSGNRVGTALQTIYNRLQLGMGVGGTAANEMLRLGVLDRNGIELNSLGGFKKYKTGKNPLLGSILEAQDPIKWFEEVLLPLYREHGIVTEEDTYRENALLFGRKGGALMNSVYRQLPQIHSGAEMAAQADTVDKTVGRAKASPQGAEMELSAAWESLKTEAGKSLLPEVTSFFLWLAGIFRSINELEKTHPTLYAVWKFTQKTPEELSYGYKGKSIGLPEGKAAQWFGEAQGGGSNVVGTRGGSQPIQVHSTINLDGRKVGESMTKHIADSLNRHANTVGSAFDPTMAVPPVGLNYAE